MTQAAIDPAWRILIGGELVEGQAGQSLVVENPYDESIVAHVPRCDAQDAERAIAAANAAKGAWGKVPGLDRAQALHEVARKIRERREELARFVTLEMGRPLLETRDEVDWIAAIFDYYAEIGRSDRGVTVTPGQLGQRNYTVKEPIGVVVCIVPWNYPLLLMIWKVAPALAAGNTVIIKPSEISPLSAIALQPCFDHLGPGVVNVVTGYGAEVGEPLITSPHTDMVAFTGSTATGRRIAVQCAERIKKVSLELGGSDPFIVCEDADVGIAARAAVWSAFLNNGQVCTSAERFFVHDSIAADFTDEVIRLTKQLRQGNPMGPDVDLGPMVTRQQRDKVVTRLAEAVAHGAVIRTGGTIPTSFAKGHFLEPTVVTNVQKGNPLIGDEIFGPVMPIGTFSTLAEAIDRANESQYGLGASILTQRLDYAMEAAENIKAGTFWVNDPLTDNHAAPFGGMKMSGLGRELGREGIDEFCEIKHVHINYKVENKGYWFPYDWHKGRNKKS
jgi:acyl-CoA reductase-like NAD-dependent aldehyde dehydrogenase